MCPPDKSFTSNLLSVDRSGLVAVIIAKKGREERGGAYLHSLSNATYKSHVFLMIKKRSINVLKIFFMDLYRVKIFEILYILLLNINSVFS